MIVEIVRGLKKINDADVEANYLYDRDIKY